MVAVVGVGVVLLGLVSAGWSRSFSTAHLTARIRTESAANNALESAQSALDRELELELQYLDDPSTEVSQDFSSAAGSFVREVNVASSESATSPEKTNIRDILRTHASDVAFVDGVFSALHNGSAGPAADFELAQQGRLGALNNDLGDTVADVQRQITQSIESMNSDEAVGFAVNAALAALGLVLLMLWWVLALRSRRLADEYRDAGENALTKARNWFRSVIENGADLTMVISKEREITYVSPSSVRILGYEPDEMREMKEGLIHSEDQTNVYMARSRCEEGGDGAIEAVEARIRHRDGTWRWFYTSFTNRLADPEFAGYVLSAHDITDRKLAESELAFSATHDSLTKLPNRTLLADRLEMSLGRSARKHAQVAVLLCDLDHFKLINDTLGPTAGDDLLIAVADRLSAAVRPGDTVSRIGGDEFVVVCEGFEGLAHIKTLAERLIGSLARPFHVADQEIFVAVSVGIRIADISTDTPDHMIRDADAAMYQAKEAGRNRAVIFDENPRDRPGAGSRSSPSCIARSNATSSVCTTSRLSRSGRGRSPVSRPSCAGRILNGASSFLRNSSGRRKARD